MLHVLFKPRRLPTDWPRHTRPFGSSHDLVSRLVDKFLVNFCTLNDTERRDRLAQLHLLQPSSSLSMKMSIAMLAPAGQFRSLVAVILLVHEHVDGHDLAAAGAGPLATLDRGRRVRRRPLLRLLRRHRPRLRHCDGLGYAFGVYPSL